MKFYSNAKELIKFEMPISIRSQLYPFFESGFKAYQELIHSHKDFFDSTFIPNIKGWLLTYMVFRQFEPDMLSKNFPFKSEAKVVNNFNYKSLNLVRNNVIINVCKAPDNNSLPCRSRYRLKYCKLNKFNEKNLFYFVNDKNKLVLKNEPYYMLLTYGYNKDGLSFVNLVVPDSKMSSILEKVELKSEMSLYTTTENEKKESEKRLATVKKEALRKLALIQRDGVE